MARSGSDISTRIGFSGSEDVKRQLENLAKAGEKALADLQRNFSTGKNPFSGLTDGAKEVKRHFDNLATSSQQSGNTTRAALAQAISGTKSYSETLKQTGVSSRNLQFALTNLSFQVNDVVSGLASGQEPMRIFAQQAGQIFQVFQTGGGLRVILGGAASAIGSIITPARLAGTAIVALAAGFALLVARAQNSDQSAKSFDITLRALGKSHEITGAQLEEGAQSLRDVGLSADEARDALRKALTEGVRPQDATRIVRIGANVAAAMGEGKEGIDRFTSAAAKGGDALREYGTKLGIIPRSAKDASTDLKSAAEAMDDTTKAARTFNDVLRDRRQQIEDNARAQAQQAEDERERADEEIRELTRVRGTEKEEIIRASNKRIEQLETQSGRRVEEINRQTNRRINELIRERNREQARRLKEFNDKIAKDAEEAAGAALLQQIEKRTAQAAIDQLSPVGKALRELGVAWNELLNTMAQSSIIQGAVQALKSFVELLQAGFKNNTTTTIIAIAGAIAGVGVAAAVVVPLFKLLVGGVAAIIAGLSSLASGAAAVGSAFLVIASAIGWPAVLLAGVTALVASFVDWGNLLSGKTWADFLGMMDAFLRMLKSIAGYLSDEFFNVWNSIWAAIMAGFEAVVKWFGDKIGGLVSSFNSLANSISNSLTVAFNVIKAAASFLGLASGGPVPRLASGGSIHGPHGTDRVPIWATAGEYMIRKSSVDYLGVGFMDMINRFPQRLSDLINGNGFAMGGLIDWQPPVFADGFARGGAIDDMRDTSHDRVSVDLTMPDGEIFEDMLTPRAVATKFGRYSRQRSRAAIGRRPGWHSGRIGG